jgi:hypothetical protein
MTRTVVNMGESFILKVDDCFDDDGVYVFNTFQKAADRAKEITKKGKSVPVCKVIEMALYEPSFTWKPLEGYGDKYADRDE